MIRSITRARPNVTSPTSMCDRFWSRRKKPSSSAAPTTARPRGAMISANQNDVFVVTAYAR
jgi:hypothetical protein